MNHPQQPQQATEYTKESASTYNGDSFESNAQISEAYNNALHGMIVYNNVLRRPRQEHENIVHSIQDGLKIMFNYPGVITLDVLKDLVIKLNVHPAAYIYENKAVFCGPTAGSDESLEFTHVKISQKYLPNGSKTSEAITGYCIFQDLDLGNYHVDGLFLSDANINYGELIKIEVPELASHPLTLLETFNEAGEKKYLLFVTSEFEKFKFKKFI